MNLLNLFVTQVYAAEISPGTGFAKDFPSLLNAILSFVMIVAALLVFYNLIMGGISWITSGGDKGKTEAARNKIVAAVVGIIIVAASYAVTLIVLNFLGFESFEDLFNNMRTIDSGTTRSYYSASEYTNLCGAGSDRNTTLCNQGCNLNTGICRSDKPYVVKFVCEGRQVKCDQNMSTFANEQNIGAVSCGKTVQIDSFDKDCRNADGSWGCTDRNILDFMVWYSGDC